MNENIPEPVTFEDEHRIYRFLLDNVHKIEFLRSQGITYRDLLDNDLVKTTITRLPEESDEVLVDIELKDSDNPDDLSKVRHISGRVKVGRDKDGRIVDVQSGISRRDFIKVSALAATAAAFKSDPLQSNIVSGSSPEHRSEELSFSFRTIKIAGECLDAEKFLGVKWRLTEEKKLDYYETGQGELRMTREQVNELGRRFNIVFTEDEISNLILQFEYLRYILITSFAFGLQSFGASLNWQEVDELSEGQDLSNFNIIVYLFRLFKWSQGKIPRLHLESLDKHKLLLLVLAGRADPQGEKNPDLQIVAENQSASSIPPINITSFAFIPPESKPISERETINATNSYVLTSLKSASETLVQLRDNLREVLETSQEYQNTVLLNLSPDELNKRLNLDPEQNGELIRYIINLVYDRVIELLNMVPDGRQIVSQMNEILSGQKEDLQLSELNTVFYVVTKDGHVTKDNCRVYLLCLYMLQQANSILEICRNRETQLRVKYQSGFPAITFVNNITVVATSDIKLHDSQYEITREIKEHIGSIICETINSLSANAAIIDGLRNLDSFPQYQVFTEVTARLVRQGQPADIEELLMSCPQYITDVLGVYLKHPQFRLNAVSQISLISSIGARGFYHRESDRLDLNTALFRWTAQYLPLTFEHELEHGISDLVVLLKSILEGRNPDCLKRFALETTSLANYMGTTAWSNMLQQFGGMEVPELTNFVTSVLPLFPAKYRERFYDTSRSLPVFIELLKLRDELICNGSITELSQDLQQEITDTLCAGWLGLFHMSQGYVVRSSPEFSNDSYRGILSVVDLSFINDEQIGSLDSSDKIKLIHYIIERIANYGLLGEIDQKHVNDLLNIVFMPQVDKLSEVTIFWVKKLREIDHTEVFLPAIDHLATYIGLLGNYSDDTEFGDVYWKITCEIARLNVGLIEELLWILQQLYSPGRFEPSQIQEIVDYLVKALKRIRPGGTGTLISNFIAFFKWAIVVHSDILSRDFPRLDLNSLVELLSASFDAAK